MGSSQSSTLVDIVNQATASVITNELLSCSSNSKQTQVFAPSNSLFFGFSAKQSATISQSCIANFKVDDSIVSKISNQIQQEAAKESVALFDTMHFDSTQAEAHIKNLVSTNITTNLVQNALVSVEQTQIIGGAGNTILGGSVVQTSDTVQKSLMSAISNTSLATTIDNQTDQKSKNSQTNPLDIFGDMLMYIIIFIIVIIVAVVGGIIYLITNI